MLRTVQGCGRCVLITTDQDTGKGRPKSSGMAMQPLKCLKATRIVQDPLYELGWLNNNSGLAPPWTAHVWTYRTSFTAPLRTAIMITILSVGDRRGAVVDDDRGSEIAEPFEADLARRISVRCGLRDVEGIGRANEQLVIVGYAHVFLLIRCMNRCLLHGF